MSLTYKHIRKKLTDASTVRGSVYSFEAPVKQKPPYVSFYLSDLEPIFTMDKATPLNIETWTIVSNDKNVEDAITNANAIRTIFDHYAGTEESVVIKQSMLTGRSIPLVEEDEQGDKVYQVVDTYEMRVT